MNSNNRVAAMEVLEQAKAAGVSFSIELDYYVRDPQELTTKEVFAYMEDPLAFRASVAAVTVPVYTEWKTYHLSQFRCTGMNKDGTPCKGWGMDSHSGPAEFIPGFTDRCHTHRNKALVPIE